MIDEEIMGLMNGIQMNKTMDNTGLNQMRNIVNALDNVLVQMSGVHSPFRNKIEQMREFYFQGLVASKNILDTSQ